MKFLPVYVSLAVAILILVGMLWTSREGFIPEIDRSQVQRTVSLEDSSYQQVTNHFTPGPIDYPEMRGQVGKDQINQWKGVVV